MPNKATAQWQGDLETGRGSFVAGETLSGQYSFRSRFENGEGVNPEHLIGAAHAACFSMALASILSDAGHTPDSIDTRAQVTLRLADGQPTITAIALTTSGVVAGIDEQAFQTAAEQAKQGCVVSRALAGVKEITLEATLKTPQAQ